MENYFHMEMDRRAINQISALGLAHCGDAVFELLVRSYLCASGRASNGNLHRATVELVCAPAQAERMERIRRFPEWYTGRQTKEIEGGIL